MIKFGPAGNSDSFTAAGHKNNLEIPEYLVKMGLNAYEYQCGRGVKISEENARVFGEKAAAHGISLSLHAPYYISLTSTEEDKRLGSIRYFSESARALKAMGGKRMVVHPGTISKRPREEVTALAGATLKLALEALDREGFSDIVVCPETMGKIGQLGTLEEVIELCLIDERLVPCIDFGHLNARTHGGLGTKEEFAAVLDAMHNRLGEYRGRNFHSHFSKIEFSAGGEVRHLTFDDEKYGPDFHPLAELIAERGLTPTIICESAGTQAEDAAAMRGMCEAAVANLKA